MPGIADCDRIAGNPETNRHRAKYRTRKTAIMTPQPADLLSSWESIVLARREPFGIVWNGQKYISGMEAIDVSDERRLNWHNDLFELCDPATLARRKTAQPQPRPKSI